MCVRERERGVREREGGMEGQRDRQTDRQTETETERQTDRQSQGILLLLYPVFHKSSMPSTSEPLLLAAQTAMGGPDAGGSARCL